MDIFKSLTSDHRLIANVLDAFEVFVGVSTTSGELDVIQLNRFCVFFREFLELSHHELEERVLLPAMESLGYGQRAAPLAHIRNEHERERGLLLELRRTALAGHPLSERERIRLLQASHEFIQLERAHMRKENDLLYPALQKEFSQRKLAELNRQAEKLKLASPKNAEQLWLRSLAHDLMNDHGPPPRTDAWSALGSFQVPDPS